MSKEQFYTFLPDGVSFTSRRAAGIKTIYAPLCGSDAAGLKSSITPNLSGDIKVDKFHYVSKPASREDLRWPLRDFFVWVDGKGVYSLAKEGAPGSTTIEMGQLWHKLTRVHEAAGVELSAVNFIPSTNETVELMRVTVKNISGRQLSFTPTAAVPVFGRSLANKHDHEHVTALLHRIAQNPDGVLLEPAMAFNEEGHKDMRRVYFVYGCDDQNAAPAGTFPTVDAFYGDGGGMDAPQAVLENRRPAHLAPEALHGKEAVGALRFKDQILSPGQSKSYMIAVGVAACATEAVRVFGHFAGMPQFDAAWEANKKFWADKIAAIAFKSGDEGFNAWMRWVVLQPVLRRIFGCSFLPDHDYGKGGKGWRDLWQDLLSLILIEPQTARAGLIDNCAGIRIDGSNATIIGAKPEFIADRNAITRVWMDHGCWPFLTLLLYIHQSGDFDILLYKQVYFRDPQMSRTFEKDLAWVNAYGHKLLDKRGHVYEGTILEHLLVQHLTQFFNVGEHNIIRLESADWNDGLDMAFAKGESVAFTAFYGGNLLKIADMIEDLGKHKGTAKIRVAKELLALLDTLTDHPVNYDHAQEKQARLFGEYFTSVQPALSGEQVELDVADVAADLRKKGHWLFGHVRNHEKITVEDGGKVYQWFNGYYDNHARRVEGKNGNAVRMTLTGQVFAVMSGLACDDDIALVMDSVEHFLRDKKSGGYRLNTDFGERHYMELGRAFGFAYGTKENGSFFSHMNVMYAYALYSRGFIRKGFEVLSSIYTMANDGEKSKIYPGIPEYFDSEGRGMYHYLTGSASWMVLTQLTQVFGVRGHYGDLVLAPKLVKEQFGRDGIAGVTCQFAGHTITVEYRNPKRLDAGAYKIQNVLLNGKPVEFERLEESVACLKRALITTDAVIAVNLISSKENQDGIV
ncbi:MAG: cellobiose phosphorylase [Candidatus Omnitrophica bacterium]|nr:cellobiose phosphorylase [Candidatus Omnitrophota bacterium]